MSYPPTSVRVRRTRRLLHVQSMLRDMQQESSAWPLDNGVRFALGQAAEAVGQALERQRQDARREAAAAGWAASAPSGGAAKVRT